MYHGAEHKTIFCYENEEELTVENVKKQSRFHPRCGTSFMVLMLIVGILVGLFVPVAPFGIGFLRPVFKILLLPVSCGIGYELIKICGKHDNARAILGDNSLDSLNCNFNHSVVRLFCCDSLRPKSGSGNDSCCN